MPKLNDTSMQDLKPTVWIGKQGSTETMIGEIVSQLKKRSLIKVKWLQNTEVDPAEIAAAAKARLVEVRGRTMVLAEKGRAAGSPPAPVKTPAKPTAKETARASRGAGTPMKAPAKSAAKETSRAPRSQGTSAKAPAKPMGKRTARAPEKSANRTPANLMRKESGSRTARQTGSMKPAKK
jgi:RNA-binding protein